MAALTTNNIVYAGTAPSFVAAETTDTAEVGPRNFVVYKNTNASPRTVTLTVPASNSPYTQADPDVSYTIAGTNGEVWIPLHSDYDEGTGRTTATLTAIAGVSVSVVKAGWTE
jgi:hypothetical protein